MYKNSPIFVIIAAAGAGKRMKSSINKQYILIDKTPVLARSIQAFEENDYVDSIILSLKKEEIKHCQKEILEKFSFKKVVKITEGGKERQDSVFNALLTIKDEKGFVLVHDGARPFVTQDEINKIVEKTFLHGGCILATPIKETIKITDPTNKIVGTVPRDNLHTAKTPQGFEIKLLYSSYEKAFEDRFYGTDDSILVERTGKNIFTVQGKDSNIKITTKEDILIGEGILKSMNSLEANDYHENFIGIGYDVHIFSKDRPLIIGGVNIPYEKGLAGHSDADVLVHAIMDSILGAAGLYDIGHHFPDTDKKYKGISSILLLKKVKEMIEKKKLSIINIDSIIVTQKPKMAPFIEEMRMNIAEALGIALARVNVKATTTEGLGFEGKEEGISAQAVVNLKRTL